MATTPSLAVRSGLAVGLLLGFYGLGLGMALALLSIPYLEVVHLHRIHLKATVFAVVGAGAILWALLPRRDRFEAPGPVIETDDAPRLHAMVGDLARAATPAPPEQVYLVPDVNAWVAERGGVGGVGRRRVMGIGLPLLQVLSVSELRAVLAHELGHYCGGDTRLGPWLYRTRAAIGRTLHAVDDAWLQKPFEWYAKLFLRLTHAVSRQQELAADALAVRLVGAHELAAGLRAVHGAAGLFAPYWAQEVLPLLRAGYRPPIADGFRQFLTAPVIAGIAEQAVADASRSTKTDPYDTHPPLAARLAALEGHPAGAPSAVEAPAISLIEDVPALEHRLLAHLFGAEPSGGLVPVDWGQAAASLWVPAWQAAVAAEPALVGGLTAGMLPQAVADIDARARGLSPVEEESDDDTRARALGILAAALGVALARSGAPVGTAPGEPVTLSVEDGPLDPVAVLRGLGSPEADTSWIERCARLGITDLSLALPAA